MFHLLLVSLVWAFSFGITGHTLQPLPPAFVSAARLLLAFLLFAPFLKRATPRHALFLMLLGAVQFGAMYLAYNAAFKHLPSHQVALLTITTPLFIALLDDLRAFRLTPSLWQAALLATLGVGIIAWPAAGLAQLPLRGVLLMQLSNLCFALGQWVYRNHSKIAHHPSNFAWMYLGAALLAMPFAWRHAPLATDLTLHQVGALVYLGLVASGVCFFLWNHGVRRVTAARMAVMNDLKIPLGVLASIWFFRETPNLPFFILGSALLCAAIWVGRKNSPAK